MKDNGISIDYIKTKYKKYNGSIIGINEYKKSAIIIPLIMINEEINILFEVRSKKLSSQPGDICFPGGKIENNENPKTTAYREIFEEMGVERQNIDIISELDTFVRYDGVLIYSYLGIINKDSHFNINPSEVDSYFFVPLKFFLENEPQRYDSDIVIKRGEDFPYDRINGGSNYKFRESKYYTYFYKYKEYNIWGITACILYYFVNYINNK